MSGLVSFGLGETFATLAGAGKAASGAGRAFAHTVTQQMVTVGLGQEELSVGGLASTFGGSLFGSGMRGAGFGNAAMIAGSAAFGGAIAELSGGDFGTGFVISGIVAAANHALHNAYQRPSKIDIANSSDQEIINQISKAMGITIKRNKASWKLKHYFKNLNDLSLTDGWTGGWQKEVNGVFITNRGIAIPNTAISIPLDSDFLRHGISIYPNGTARQVANNRLVYDFVADIPGARMPLKLMAMYVPSWTYDLNIFR